MKIGRLDSLHYLERQRIVMLNAISSVSIIGSVLITIAYVVLDFNNKYIGLIVIPTCLLVYWFNHKKKYKIARNVIFLGMLCTITFWSFYTRRTGSQFLYIAVASGSVAIFREKISAYRAMLTCLVLFFFYVYYDNRTPFVADKTIDYFIINTILIVTTGGIVFFQAMVNMDISKRMSKRLDNKFIELNSSIENQKIIEEKLQASNLQLLDFNKKLDTLVRQSNEELYSYQMAINDNLSSVVTDFEGKILKINDIYLEETGYTKEEILGKNISILRSDYHTNVFYKNINEAIASGSVWRGESNIKTKSGNTFWISSSILPIKNSIGKIQKFLTISSNVTDKKIAEEKEKFATEKLFKSEKRFSLLFENQTDLIVISDKTGNRRYVNKAFCDFYGKSKEHFIGTNYGIYKADDILEDYTKLFDSISFVNPKISTIEVLENALNEKRWIQWNEVALFDANQSIVEIHSIGRDITEIKENEFINASYIAQFEELAFKNSHHFRKPLSNILGVTSLFDEESSLSEVNELVEIIKSEINELDIASQELSNFINSNSKNNIQNRDVYNADFTEAKLKHLKWKYKIKNFFVGKGSLTYSQATSHEQSDIGKWFYSEGKEKYGYLSSVQKFEEEHKFLHEVAKEIIALKAIGEIDKVELKYQELIAASDKIILLLDESEQIVNAKNASTLS